VQGLWNLLAKLRKKGKLTFHTRHRFYMSLLESEKSIIKKISSWGVKI
jgi:hypothetical protein